MFAHVLTEEYLRHHHTDLKKCKRQIAAEVGTTITTVDKYCKRHGVSANTRADYVSADLTGIEFDRLKVIGRAENDRHGKARWECQCACGKTKAINASSLTRGLSRSCGCLKTELVRIGYKDISSSFWRRMVQSAGERGYEFTITPEVVWGVYEDQGRCCALSGVPIEFHPNSNYPNLQTASVDRRDSHLGYVPENIQVVHKSFNLAKSYFEHDEFVAMCNLVASVHNMARADAEVLVSRTLLKKSKRTPNS